MVDSSLAAQNMINGPEMAGTSLGTCWKCRNSWLTPGTWVQNLLFNKQDPWVICVLVKSDGSSFSLCQPVSSCRQVGRGTVRVGTKASGARSVVPALWLHFPSLPSRWRACADGAASQRLLNYLTPECLSLVENYLFQPGLEWFWRHCE